MENKDNTKIIAVPLYYGSTDLNFHIEAIFDFPDLLPINLISYNILHL